MRKGSMARLASLILLCLLTVPAMTAQAAVQFIYPAPSTWVGSSSHLILKLNQLDLTAIRVTVNGLSSDLIDVGSPEYRKLFNDFFIAQAMWDSGKNTIQVDLFKGGQKIEAANAEIYYVPQDSNGQAPPEYLPNTMHVPEKEVLCAPCHNMNPTPAQMNSNVEKENPCFGCHKKMLTTKYVHGPAGTYSCGYCHSVKWNPKYAVPKQGAPLCYECHADMAEQIKKKKFIHGPIEAGMCQACHDSHGTANEYQLLKPVNELCLSCHGHIRNQFHVIRSTTGGGHPLSGKPDPLKKASGKELSCISCHNPHAGNVRYYFINDAEDRMTLCQTCHNK